MASITKGTAVRVGRGSGIPIRYQRRQGVVVGKRTTPAGFVKFAVGFPGRRAEPLYVAASRLTVL